jgi:hypothetical protein
MTYRGRVQNGVVVPEAGAVLPEGAEVSIDVQAPADAGETAAADSNGATPISVPNSMIERYRNIIGVLNTLPEDASERVDDFLYGTPES